MKKIFIYILISILFISLGSCKKTKLDGEYSTYLGNWSWVSGAMDYGSNDLKLEMKAKGKFNLYKGNKKIEYGRLVEQKGELRFFSNNLRRFQNEELFLNVRQINGVKDDIMYIGNIEKESVFIRE